MTKNVARPLRWVRLDNAAKIYPAARRKNWSNVFHQSVTLFDDVDTAVLKSALDVTVKRFPSIAARLRKGVFCYVTGALVMTYVAFALPMWFRKPNPVIFVPCNFVSAGLYLLYINFATQGNWFLCFAFPVLGGLGLITCAVVTLLYYLPKGRLYILGGAFMALGAFMLLIEFLMGITFGLRFVGWAIYPMVVLVIFGGLLIYLAINDSAREMMERKLFF